MVLDRSAIKYVYMNYDKIRKNERFVSIASFIASIKQIEVKMGLIV